MFQKLLLAGLCLVSGMSFGLDATSNGNWISLGAPSYIHMGTDGRFYLNGTNQGSCSGVRPNYFRMDMNDPQFNNMYSWILLMSAQKKPMDCIVKSGCGSTEIWVDYCRGSIN